MLSIAGTYVRCVRPGRCARYATSENDRLSPEIDASAELRQIEDPRVLRVAALPATGVRADR
jgi:hypothetical protein